jgi:hypothetical protein
MCVFSQVQLFRLVFFNFNSSCVKIVNKILKFVCCLTLLCVVVCVSRDYSSFYQRKSLFNVVLMCSDIYIAVSHLHPEL